MRLTMLKDFRPALASIIRRKKRLQGTPAPGAPRSFSFSAVRPKKHVAPGAGAAILRAPFPGSNFMSQHRSLKGLGAIVAKRNVLKRFERVEVLQKRGVFKPGQKVIGLPKTKPIE
jgi:small basic protein (TIGR04137 family)